MATSQWAVWGRRSFEVARVSVFVMDGGTRVESGFSGYRWMGAVNVGRGVVGRRRVLESMMTKPGWDRWQAQAVFAYYS